jgi:predicted dehydrogenase
MTQEIAIAGIGAVAEVHARAIADIDDATLVAGSCRTDAKGREFAGEFDCEYYADTEAMLDGTDPDVLSVCTPSGAHLDPTLAAADRGVHVLCEKPLEITTDRVDEMVEACEAAGVRLGGVFQGRYTGPVGRVHDAVAEGRFGDLSVVSASVPWWREDDYYEGAWQGTEALDGGGAVMNQSIHGVDAIQWIAGAGMDLDPGENPVEEVFAFTDTLAHDGDHVEVEDTAVATLRYRDGTLGHLLAATSMYPGSRKLLRVGGRDGTAEVAEDDLTTWAFRDGDSDEDGDGDDESDGDKGGAADPMAIDNRDHKRNIEAFLDAVAAGEPFMLDAAEARKAVAIVEAIYESAERGAPVRVE